MIRLLNLTPHPLHIHTVGGAVVELPVDGEAARIREIRSSASLLDLGTDAVALTDVYYADHVDGVPAPVAGVVYVVSRVAADRIRRSDIVFPLDEIRDEAGNIVGCRGLGRFGGGS